MGTSYQTVMFAPANLVSRTELDGICVPPDVFECNMDVYRRSKGKVRLSLNAAVIR
jgi:hypothetical protein